MKQIINACVAFAAGTVCFFNAGAQKSGYHLAGTFHIASAGGWDYLAANGNKLYVSHGTQVNILDKQSGDSVGFIPNTTGVHGIAFIPALNKGYTSNGRLNTVTVFELSTNKVLSQIATGQNPDAIMYDSYSKRIITCNGHSSDLSIIDPATEKVTATIPVGGKPETAVSNDAGKLYVNIEDKNEIVEVSLQTNKVEKRWSLSPAEGPTGLSYDKDTKRLFAGCEKMLAVLNAENGKLVDKITIGDGCDGVAFDKTTKTIFTSNGEGTMTVIKETSADKYEVVENLTTKRGARTITLDEDTHAIYLPTADFEAPPAEGKRPAMIPGSFQVLVFKK